MNYFWTNHLYYVFFLSIPGMVLPPGYSQWLFSYKPFLWCRSDARLRHAYCSFNSYKPFMWCRPDARLRHYYSCSFLSRSHSDPRLAPVLLFLQFPLEESFRPSVGTSITILAVSSRGVIQTLVWHPVFILGFREDYRPTSLLFFPCIIFSMSERTC